MPQGHSRKLEIMGDTTYKWLPTNSMGRHYYGSMEPFTYLNCRGNKRAVANPRMDGLNKQQATRGFCLLAFTVSIAL